MSEYDTGSLQTDPTAGTDTMTDREPGTEVRVPVAGGVLVYETRGVGRELVGFAEVDNWDDLADALAARGHSRGAIYHLPELEVDEERGA